MYLSNIVLALGERRRAVAELTDDARVAARYEAEGSTCALLAESSAERLALRCAEGSLAALERDHAIRRSTVAPVLVATGDADLAASTGLGRVSDELAVDPSATFAISGHSCSSLGLSLRLQRALLDSGGHGHGAIVLSNVYGGGSRLVDFNMSLLSDAAAACIVSDRPYADSFEVVALHSTSTETIKGLRGDLADVKSARQALDIARSLQVALGTIRDELTRSTGLEFGSFEHILVNSYGSRTRRFFEMTIGVPLSECLESATANYGHCHSVDPLVQLNLLQRSGALTNSDRILILTDSIHRWEAVALRYCGDRPGPDYAASERASNTFEGVES